MYTDRDGGEWEDGLPYPTRELIINATKKDLWEELLETQEERDVLKRELKGAHRRAACTPRESRDHPA